jgi:hypothetical protein
MLFWTAALNLAEAVGPNFRITHWTTRAREAYAGWKSATWDWNEIFRRHKDPDRLDMAVWTSVNELAALALATTTSRAVHLRFVEGAPGEFPTLKGYRLSIVLEAVACYAQLRGKAEIRATPLNDELTKLCKTLWLRSCHRTGAKTVRSTRRIGHLPWQGGSDAHCHERCNRSLPPDFFLGETASGVRTRFRDTEEGDRTLQLAHR